MKKKMMYDSPEVEVIELKLDFNVMQSASPVSGGPGSDDEIDDQGDF